MFREGTCPQCREKIQVPDDREKIICMYCGEEISVRRALGEEKKETDPVAYGENYNLAMAGLKELIRTCYQPMQNFKKDLYEGAFETFYSSHRRMFEAMEYVHRSAEQPQDWLEKMAECVIEEARADLNTYKLKNRRSQRLMDYNFLLSVYLVPAVLKYPAGVSEPFADCLIASWNKAFQTSIGKARYDDIDSGFHRKLCYITTAVCENIGKGTDCPELRLLKDYRDRYMDVTPEGHALVEEYYDIAPTIVKRIARRPERDRIYRQIYETYLQPCIREIETRQYEACEARYRQMVLELKKQYMDTGTAH